MASSSEDPEDLVVLESSGYAHGAPPEGLECAATYEDITAEDQNYVEYQTAPSGAWHAAKYAEETVCRFIRVQFDEYVAGVRKADCEADLRRRIGKGPPIWLADKHALPVPDDDTHVCRLWLARTGREYSAKLKGALEGDARQKLWDELSAFMPPKEEAKAGDDQAADDQAADADDQAADAVAKAAIGD